MCRIDEFWNIHETFPHFFSKQAKLRQAHRAETADFRFQISNFEIRQISFLMKCRPHQMQKKKLFRLKYGPRGLPRQFVCPSISRDINEHTGTLVETQCPCIDLSFASTETKFQNPITKTQNNIVIFGCFHKKMILSFWLFLK